MLEARNQDAKSFIILCMKNPDHVMKIMVIWMKLDDLEGARTSIYFIESYGMKEKKSFTHRQTFGIYFRYRHQVDNQNNRRHAKISFRDDQIIS